MHQEQVAIQGRGQGDVVTSKCSLASKPVMEKAPPDLALGAIIVPAVQSTPWPDAAPSMVVRMKVISEVPLQEAKPPRLKDMELYALTPMASTLASSTNRAPPSFQLWLCRRSTWVWVGSGGGLEGRTR